MPQYIVGNIFGYRSYKIVELTLKRSIWPDSNCWCWGASCLSHAIWMRWSFTRPRASQKASAGFRSTPSQVYIIYIYIWGMVKTQAYHLCRECSPVSRKCTKHSVAKGHQKNNTYIIVHNVHSWSCFIQRCVYARDKISDTLARSISSKVAQTI